jgi:L-lysine 2,3-aminomutase
MPTTQRSLRSADTVAAASLIQPEARPAIEAAARRYAIAITPAMQALIERPDDPIGRQFIPDPAELIPRHTKPRIQSPTMRCRPSKGLCTAIRIARC